MKRFKKQEKLCSKKLIDKLLFGGTSFIIYPFKVFVFEEVTSCSSPVKVLIIVSKRRFKNAVTRNLIKRRIREGYRINKDIFYRKLDENKKKIIFALSYIGNEIHSSKDISCSIVTIFTKTLNILDIDE
jgi:ribonuclease P protein component